MSYRKLKKAKYDAVDKERFLAEEHHTRRSDFERDRGRLIHSSALRRLGQKTAVFSPTAGLDFARNRLTHSLEVAQVGRELGKALGLNPNVVETACLAHDLGHPPFGHNGETALQEWISHWGGFEGNAQTLRILTRLEPKRIVDGVSYGLNLTRASLDASCKYPWGFRRGIEHADALKRPLKFGVYEDDLPVFAWLREGAPPERKCIEAQTMDLADDIAYSVHDFEDALVERFIDPDLVNDPTQDDALVRAVEVWTGTPLPDDALLAAIHRLRALPEWLREWDGSPLHQARLKNLTSELIGRFCAATTDATRDAYPTGSLIRYRASIVVPEETEAEITVLKGIVGTFIMSAGARQPYYARQRELLYELIEVLWMSGDRHLDPQFAEAFRAADDEGGRRRAIVDQVASLTDVSAIAWHARLVLGVEQPEPGMSWI